MKSKKKAKLCLENSKKEGGRYRPNQWELRVCKIWNLNVFPKYKRKLFKNLKQIKNGNRIMVKTLPWMLCEKLQTVWWLQWLSSEDNPGMDMCSHSGKGDIGIYADFRASSLAAGWMRSKETERRQGAIYSKVLTWIANAGDMRDRFNPCVRKIPRRRCGNPHQYSCLENFMKRGAWWATIHSCTGSDITEVT